MGFRSRIKKRIKKVLQDEPESAGSGAVVKPETSPQAVPSPVVMPKPVVVPKPVVAPVQAAAEPQDEEERKKQEKVARHLEKTRRGVLQFVVKQGGSAPLAEMHKHSEMRYFIAHQKFSKMMEALVDEGLLSYSQSEGVGTITEAGQRWLED